MNTRTVLAAAAGLLLATSGLGNAQSLPALKHEKYTLPNGLTVILHEDHSVPLVTVFGFIAQPDLHIFLKPRVTRNAAHAYGFELDYAVRPSWETYASLLEFAAVIRRDLRDLRPRDMIDIQSFLWVQGSDEYAE